MGLPATSGQHDVLLTPRHPGDVVGLATVPQHQPLSQMPLQANASYAMGPPQVGFLSELSLLPFCIFICFLVCSGVYAFCFQAPCWMLYSHIGAQTLGFAPLQPFEAYPWQAYVQPGDGHQPTPGMHRVIAPSTA